MTKGQFHQAIEAFAPKKLFSLAGQDSYPSDFRKIEEPMEAAVFLRCLANYVDFDYTREERAGMETFSSDEHIRMKQLEKWATSRDPYPSAEEPLCYGHIDQLGHALLDIKATPEDGMASGQYQAAIIRVRNAPQVLEATIAKLEERGNRPLAAFSNDRAMNRIRNFIRDGKLAEECARINEAGHVVISPDEVQKVVMIERKNPCTHYDMGWLTQLAPGDFNAVVQLGAKMLKHDALQSAEQVRDFYDQLQLEVLSRSYQPKPKPDGNEPRSPSR